MKGDLVLHKRQLREAVLGKRDALDPKELKEAGKQICNRIRVVPEYSNASVILGYTPYRSEVDTVPVLLQALRDGKTLALPRVNKHDKTLTLLEVHDLDEDLVPGAWGIIEPDPLRCREIPIEAVDFILVPGSVLDWRGGRMGYGAGFYDRLLDGLNPSPFCVAAALDMQIVDEVPMEPHDLFLDMIVTPTKTRYCKGQG
ncbi:MAG: 5-formyltetrahydrofolate cyclo-ligase [Proteobacteria bacterium]|nr:5-formyltetrahydrofolate cyclo-ligase [Pseudomonadota bacterium]MDE3207508.1 5-formyltetrahydrofolate cyclo-ligase [Pseudomonadota bacterium]